MDIAKFEDKYGDERTIHKTRHGLKVKRQSATPILKLNQTIARPVGARIRALRQERGITMVELATRCGIHSGWPKQRMYEIENSTRKEGLRLGTLYALAMALEVEVCDLLPSVAEVRQLASIGDVHVPSLSVMNPPHAARVVSASPTVGFEPGGAPLEGNDREPGAA